MKGRTPLKTLNLPTTSLIITTYNKPDYLRLAIRTALRQTVPPHEVIVADDGSTEESFEVTRALRRETDVPIVHVWQEDKGFRLNRSRNNAIAVATGEYIALLDGDCFIGPRYIEDHARTARPGFYVAGTRTHLLAERRDYVLKTGDTRIGVFTSGTTKRLHSIRSRFLSRLTSETGTLDEEITPTERRGVAGANLAFWRADALKVNGFDERFEGYGGNDVEFANRLTRAGVRRYKVEHLAVAYHFAHGGRVYDFEEVKQKFADAMLAEGYRVPDDCGVTRALRDGADRVER